MQIKNRLLTLALSGTLALSSFAAGPVAAYAAPQAQTASENSVKPEHGAKKDKAISGNKAEKRKKDGNKEKKERPALSGNEIKKDRPACPDGSARPKKGHKHQDQADNKDE